MNCLKCGNPASKYETGNEYTVDEFPNIVLIDVLLLCKSCGWGFNCKGTKEIKPITKK